MLIRAILFVMYYIVSGGSLPQMRGD